VCHQSVGLIAREIEATGIPTLCMTSAWSITAAANPPRSAFLDFPLGHTAGRPDEPEEQVSIMRDALALFGSIAEPGQIVPLDYAWPEPWKHEARALKDHRTPRHDTPQYERDADRAAAVARFGEEIACAVCAPGDVPMD
jgi:hypothetical protein